MQSQAVRVVTGGLLAAPGLLGLEAALEQWRKNTTLMMLSTEMAASIPKSSSSLQHGPAQPYFPDNMLLGIL